MATTFVDIDRARLLDVVPGRSGQVVRDWVATQPPEWADQIAVAAIDAFGGYATAIGEMLPDATLVIDHSTPSASPPPPSPTPAGGCNKTPSATAAAPGTRSTGSADCCYGRGPT